MAECLAGVARLPPAIGQDMDSFKGITVQVVAQALRIRKQLAIDLQMVTEALRREVRVVSASECPDDVRHGLFAIWAGIRGKGGQLVANPLGVVDTDGGAIDIAQDFDKPPEDSGLLFRRLPVDRVFCALVVLKPFYEGRQRKCFGASRVPGR